MKRKGFTLIELLAVILILGIIALIAIPTVNDIIKESKMGAFNSSVKNIVSTIENNCQVEKMKGQAITKLYVFTSNGVLPKIDIKGSLPTSGSIALNDDCEVVVDVSNGSNTIKKSLLNDEYNVTDGDSTFGIAAAPLNKNTKKNIFFVSISIYDISSIYSQISALLNDQENVEFISKAVGHGENYYLDSSDQVIGYFEVLVIPNTYTIEEANNHAKKFVEEFKSVFTSIAAETHYYINNEYIILIGEGMSSFPNELQLQIQTSYVSQKNNHDLILEEYEEVYNDYYKYLEIIY